MFPEPTELRLMGCSTESIWTPRSKSNMLTPKKPARRHAYRRKHSIFFVCWTSWISRCFLADTLFHQRGRSAVAKPRPMNFGIDTTSRVRRRILRKIWVIQTAWEIKNWIRVVFQFAPGNWALEGKITNPDRKVEVAQCADLRLSVPWESLQESAEKVESRRKRTTNYRSVEDQRTDLVTVYDDNNESRHSPWTKLHWEFGSFQEHELEELQNLFHITQMLVLHHQREILNVKTIERTSLSWTRSALSHMEYFPRTYVIGNPPENPWRPARSKHWTWEIRRTNHLHVDVQWCLMDKERKLSTTYFKFRTCRKNTGHSWTWRWKEMVWNSKFVHLKADGIPL